MSEYEPLLRGSFHTLPSSPRKASQTMLIRSGSRYGSGRNRTPLTTLKTASVAPRPSPSVITAAPARSEEHTSELQSQSNLVCRLLLEKKKRKNKSLDT